ncbi:MAG: hypothetical protein JNL97_15025, partial [Verrucomicrobiales bacterium]|nr:hypothetical protein [Verrucomicrobiales bacterium]
AAFDSSGTWVATSSADRTVRIWSADTGQPRGEPMKHPSPVVRVRFAPGGRSLLTAAREGRARLWDVPSGLPLTDWIALGTEVNDARFDPAGTRFLLASQDGAVRFWEISSSPLPVPDWLPVVAEALVGAGFDRSGILVPTDPDLFVAARERVFRVPRNENSTWFSRIFSDPVIGVGSVSAK